MSDVLDDRRAVRSSAGEIVALLGGNGAGKTALLETILGFRPRRASACSGATSAPLSVEQRVALGVGYVPEGRRVFAGLTVRENLEAASSLPAVERRRRVEEMLALFPMLGERPEARAWLLSGGQQQMLALARAADERAAAAAARRADARAWRRWSSPICCERLAAMAADGTAILLAEQRAALALARGEPRRGAEPRPRRARRRRPPSCWPIRRSPT